MIAQPTRARAGFVTLYAAVGALFPFIPIYYGSLGISLDGIGLLGALSAASAAVGSPLWGLAADRFGASRAVLPVSALAAAIAATALALVDPVIPLVVAVAALGFCMAGAAPILDARALEAATGDRHRYGQLRVWGSASFILGVLVVGWLIDLTQIRVMFVVLVGSLLATAIVGAGFRGRALVDEATPRLAALRSVLRSPGLGRFLLAALLVWSSSMAINAFFSIRLLEIGADESVVGTAWAIGALVEIPLMLGYPWLGARIGLQRLMLAGAAILLLRAVAVATLRDPLLVTATMGLHGAAFALVLVGGVVYVSRLAPPGAAATAQGVLGATVFGLSAIIGPGLGGSLAGAFGLEGLFAIAAVGSAVALLALAWALRPDSLAALTSE
ncbi:MAG TPA: MFS transporter [Candidatus Limnocylindria bacterium]|nr:MFS transporter [Candidatus Limnocylindria bacterium]